MATGYLRPSADGILAHSCSSGSEGYKLLNETSNDGDSTYIYLVNSGINGSSKNATSTFTLSGTLPSFDTATVNSATLHAWYKVEVESNGNESNTDWSGEIALLEDSSNVAKYSGSDDTESYQEITTSALTTGYNFGSITSKGVTVYSKLYNAQTKTTTSYNRVSQIYVQVEYTGYWYVDSSTVWGCGCTCPSRQTVEDGTSTTLTFTLDSGKSIVRLLDNGTDVTSSVSQSGTTATYTISSIGARHTLQVYTELPYYKQNGVWNEVKAVYKKVNGSWVAQTDFHDLFDLNAHYKKSN